MYLIKRETNSVEELNKRSFSDLGFKERQNLQEWISQNPDILGEELLIIQKEFNGFIDTNERLDLLALDKQGNLVIIENKLDDSGKDVTWQVLKYASYCSSLTKNQIREIYQNYLIKIGSNQNATESLSEFFDNVDFDELKLNQGSSQRIIMVAANFRKEVTSTVLWLQNYKLRIQCIKVTPYSLNDNLILDVEQIIPIKDVEEYVISMAEKAQDDINIQETGKYRYNLRMEFWTRFLKEMNQKSDIYSNVGPSRDNWIGTGSGLSGVAFNSVISNYYARSEVYISRSSKEENKFIFDLLYKMKEQIEGEFGDKLVWERLDDKKACRIKFELLNVSYFNKDDWDKMIEHMIDGIQRIEKSFKKPIKTASDTLKKIK